VFTRTKELQKPQRLQRFEKPRENYVKELVKASVDNCGDCKQAISMRNEVYCGLLREKINGDKCSGCPHFALEPSEYKLFKRT